MSDNLRFLFIFVFVLSEVKQIIETSELLTCAAGGANAFWKCGIAHITFWNFEVSPRGSKSFFVFLDYPPFFVNLKF